MPRLPKSLTLGLLLAIAGVTWWLFAHGTRGAEIANVLALPIAVIGLASALFGGNKILREPALRKPTITTLWICISCGKQIRAKVSPGEVGFGPCPRCGVMGSIQLLPSGELEVATNAHKRDAQRATYRVRSYCRCIFKVSDFKRIDLE